MITGIGVDIVRIERIAQSIERFGNRFISRVFTEEEYVLALAKGKHRRLAMFFAAKEAVSKALGSGFSGFGMRDIEVIIAASGQPGICLHRGALHRGSTMGVDMIHLSLSDDDGLATAFAIAESRKT